MVKKSKIKPEKLKNSYYKVLHNIATNQNLLPFEFTFTAISVFKRDPPINVVMDTLIIICLEKNKDLNTTELLHILVT